MPIRKRLLILLAAVMVMSTAGINVFAHEVPDTLRKGSVRVTMRMGETVVPGGTLTLYRVGAVAEDDGNYSFALAGEFTDSKVSLEDIQSARLAEELAAYAKEHHIIGTTKEIDSGGSITFSDLELGLYLLMQNEAASGYSKAAPFLVSVPLNEGGTYIYDVDASPKVEVKKEPKPVTPPATPSKPGLPQTGQLNWPVPVLVLLGLCLFSVGWVLHFGKRNGGYEK